MRCDFRDGGQVDDCVLVFESRNELVEGIRVGDAVNSEVWREGCFGGGAGKNLNVPCEARVGVQGREDGGAEIAGGLEGMLGIADRGGVVMFDTPITMMFLSIDAIPGAWNDWPTEYGTK